MISKQYLENLSTFPDVRVLGIADLDTARAAAVAAEHGVPASGDLDTILALPEVEIVVNLTIPAAHAEVAMAAITAGKHVYGEKPLAMTTADGAKTLAMAAEGGLLVGSAPDTFLGSGLQSAIQVVESGAIGEPVAAALITRGPGPERWHPSPAFLYQQGAGPLFDIGPYHLTALVAALGPIAQVAGLGRRAQPWRTVGSGPLKDTRFEVEVDTHVIALLDFAAGPSASATFSFDSAAPLVSLEITGTEGVLKLPDPNTFGGPVRAYARGSADWHEVPVKGHVAGRGLGVLDLARAVRTGQPPRASGALGMHVLEAMSAILDSTEHVDFRTLTSTVDRPAALPADWNPCERTLS
ncbi:Gfo/Idh/MocA family oxidoreductase [Fodinicola feengrottensis]|uniref:Gfo/Idh/MocA family oxidoreductase n=1 Tax=Fodinicola feengrottensis TaxID=435914 RepID=A0ABP4TIR0_9ACTN